MKSIIHLAMVCCFALTAVACGSDDNNTANTNTTADTGSAVTDAGGAADTGSAAADTNTGAADTGTGAADTGTGAADTGSTSTTNNCEPSDNQCVATCAQTACSTEFQSCATNAKCAALLQCINGCASGVQPPEPTVPMPDGSTPTTCNDKCVANAGDEGLNIQQEVALCSIGKCVKEIPGVTTNCAQGNNQCLNNCIAIKCLDSFKACNGDEKCIGLLQCLGKCPQGDQNCQQGCALTAGQGAITNLTNLQSCMSTYCLGG